jgi:hypothetical protein
MNAEPPLLPEPGLETGLPPANRVNLARWGMRLSLVAPLVILLFLVFQPG